MKVLLGFYWFFLSKGWKGGEGGVLAFVYSCFGI
jgi:hypothetical protein